MSWKTVIWFTFSWWLTVLPSWASAASSSSSSLSSSPTTIHVCLHSHVDPGWRNTMEELYSLQVRSIYSSMMEALSLSPSRTFNVEITVYFARWWAEQDDDTKASVRKLVQRGQLEFVGGGWVQNDEAIVRFEDMIDQTTLGHLWLKQELDIPGVYAAWQADPFGHSNTQTYLFSLMGMNGYMFGRPISQGDDPINRQSAALWHASQSHGGAASMEVGASGFDEYTVWTAAQDSGYWQPYRDMRPTLLDALDTGDYSKPALILDQTVTHFQTFKSPSLPHYLLMLGDDLAFSTAGDAQGNATLVYPALEATLALLNQQYAAANRSIVVQLSTVTRYLKSLATASDTPLLPSRPSWDMFPLICCGHPAPWVGFYLSRPVFKTAFYAASALRRAATTLHALTAWNQLESWYTDYQQLQTVWEAVALVQHHDALTGTSLDYVMSDFLYRIQLAVGNATQLLNRNIQLLLQQQQLQRRQQLQLQQPQKQKRQKQGIPITVTAMNETDSSSPYLCYNISFIPCSALLSRLQSSEPVSLILFNPTSFVRNEFVSFLLPSSLKVVIIDDDNADDKNSNGVVPSQVATSWMTAQFNIQANEWSFYAKNLPPLGVRRFTVHPAASFPSSSSSESTTRVFHRSSAEAVNKSGNDEGQDDTVSISNGFVTVSMSTSSMTLTSFSVHDPSSGATTSVPLTASLLYYTSPAGSESAYDFSTHQQPSSAAKPYACTGAVSDMHMIHTRGNVYDELRVECANAFLGYRVYQGDSDEAWVHIYSISLAVLSSASFGNMDVVLRLASSNFSHSSSTFYTDANGLELQKRTRDARPWWKNGSYIDANEPVSSNYYPITSMLLLRNNNGSISESANDEVNDDLTLSLLPVLVSHGGASLVDGEIEVLMNRAPVDSSGHEMARNGAAFLHDVMGLHTSFAQATQDARPRAAQLFNPILVFAIDADDDFLNDYNNHDKAGSNEEEEENEWQVDTKEHENNVAATTTTSGLPFSSTTPSLSTASLSPLPAALELITLQLLPWYFSPSEMTSSSSISSSSNKGSASSLSSMPNVLLLRLRHIYGVGEAPSLAVATSVDLKAWLSPVFNVSTIVEMSLTATDTMDHVQQQRIQWKQLPLPTVSMSQHEFDDIDEDDEQAFMQTKERKALKAKEGKTAVSNTSVTLNPADIKTFMISF